jgi:hypothetical protein
VRGVTFNCNFDFFGTGLQDHPSKYRILILGVTSRLSEVVNALNAHDSTLALIATAGAPGSA